MKFIKSLNIHRKQHQLILATLIFLTVCFLILLIRQQRPTLIGILNEMIPYGQRPKNSGSNTLLNPLNSTKNQTTDSSGKTIRLKTILIWNSPGRIESVAGFGTGHQPFIDYGCPVSHCYIQVNESSEFWSRATANNSEVLKSFDAIVINIFNLTFLPDFDRPFSQRFIWLSEESPGNEKGLGNIDENPTMFDHLFNWTMTYKRDSDIQLVYGRIHPISNRTQNETKLREGRRAALAKKKDTVVWMVSHCETRGRREDYVRQLQNYINVDIQGYCGSNVLSCWQNQYGISEAGCYEMINQKYKFYLAFENVLCKDYVTEKFFSILELDVVPVVFGAADYRSIAPEHSYIDASDFSSPAKLAEYLHSLDGNDELYLDYLEWKSRYWVEAGMAKMNRHAFCDLCAKLNREDEPKKVYESMIPSWSFSTQCKPGWKP